MSISIEADYREHLSNGPECLVAAFDSSLPEDQLAYDPVTRLVRGLCFEPAKYFDTTKPAFGEQLPYMMDHGVRQIALATEVMADEEIRDSLPSWLDSRLFNQSMLVADVGLAHVPSLEVENVHEFGPKYAVEYTNHPDYGYGMAQAIGLSDPSSQVVASFIARHHMIQARNQYGLDWNDIDHNLIDPDQVDVMVALQKPFDYFDDCFDQYHDSALAYEDLISVPLKKFIHSSGQLLCKNLALISAIDCSEFNPSLPGLICTKIEEQIMGETAIGGVYRELRRSLVTT